jgi:hypothetical protein
MGAGAVLLMLPQIALAGADSMLGLIFLADAIVRFLGIQLAVALMAAFCAAPLWRGRAFLVAWFAWLLVCVVLSWGPSIMGVTLAWVTRQSWGSYSGDFPGYSFMLVRYIAVNHLVPFPPRGQGVAAAVAVWAAVLALRFRTRIVVAGGVALIVGTLVMWPSVEERLMARRCAELHATYDYVVGACHSDPRPYLPRHQRKPLLSAAGSVTLVAGLVLLIVGAFRGAPARDTRPDRE